MQPVRRHVWCELVPYARLREPAVIRALLDRQVQPILAVTPRTLPGLVDTVRALRQGGLSVGVWPMLGDADGRWLSTANVTPYQDFVVRLVTALHDRDALPDELALDLEPPIAGVRALLQGQPRQGGRPLAGAGTTSTLRALVCELEATGVATAAAVLPFTVARGARAGRGWQRLLGTPVDELGVSRVSPMAYTTLFEGYSRGVVSRRDALALLDEIARATAARFGVGASLSLGCIGTGALGDERTYRSPDELAEDVAVASAAGVDDLRVFNLGGMLARGPIEPWLDALVAPPTTAPRVRRTLRTRALVRTLGLVGALADRAT